MKNGYTDIQQSMLNVLADGQRHSKDELKTCLQDDLAEHRTAVSRHISALRTKLNPIGEEIVCEVRYRRAYYRHVRLLASANDGKR